VALPIADTSEHTFLQMLLLLASFLGLLYHMEMQKGVLLRLVVHALLQNYLQLQKLLKKRLELGAAVHN